jgi:hypothetical protein
MVLITACLGQGLSSNAIAIKVVNESDQTVPGWRITRCVYPVGKSPPVEGDEGIAEEFELKSGDVTKVLPIHKIFDVNIRERFLSEDRLYSPGDTFRFTFWSSFARDCPIRFIKDVDYVLTTEDLKNNDFSLGRALTQSETTLFIRNPVLEMFNATRLPMSSLRVTLNCNEQGGENKTLKVYATSVNALAALLAGAMDLILDQPSSERVTLRSMGFKAGDVVQTKINVQEMLTNEGWKKVWSHSFVQHTLTDEVINLDIIGLVNRLGMTVKINQTLSDHSW